jgi:hypothetical protein
MKKVFENRIAFVTALTGRVLMGMAIVFRINLVEGSVVPSFLTRTALGNALIIFLLVACMPIWIPVVWVSMKLPIPYPTQWPLACVVMLLAQGFLYCGIGKIISFCVLRGRSKN